MGFRYRKSINVGGGFRINISKTGIGYSWGVKGYRVTKTAIGNIRKTASIPGTGISYVEENNNSTKHLNSDSTENNYYNSTEISNADAKDILSDGLQDIILSAKKALQLNTISTFGLFASFLFLFVSFNMFILFFILLFIFKIYIRKKYYLNLEYNIDDEQLEIISNRMQPIVKAAESQKVWRILQTNNVINTKISAGASTEVKRVSCTVVKEAVFPFKVNVPAISLKTAKETLVFLPDKLFILQGTNVGALNYSDLTVSAHTKRFIESGTVPKDTNIVGYTWQYVNKSGLPDKRFKNNKQLPICQYGELCLKSSSGLNTVIMFSNGDLK